MNGKIAVFGSAFDPIHNGHIDCLKQVDGRYERLIIVPSYKHAFGKRMASFDQRLRLVAEALAAECFVSDVIVSDIEKILGEQDTGCPIYTYDVLNALAKEYGTDSMDFIVGPDNADPKQWAKFYRAEEITQRWGLVAVKQQQPVRSSLIREALANAGSLGKLKALIPETVVREIELQKLYQH